ncbi:membrane alanyl aminopeptidase-like isoform X2 [Spodoptera frugiperda]|uniref:Membrane alanyl aminopeptidase-like isoform X2 n=1 Tax=Spodoptera frugiperda TaxID=7108 RepID=A0A9R0D383_SPOFR|nr:membrane alanyl aminopeptidase-like isoform X2 [Spodoptera frugiperda]
MVWSKFKWKCIFFTYIILFNVFTNSLPATKSTSLENFKTEFATKTFGKFIKNYSDILDGNKNVFGGNVPVNATRSDLFRSVRPGQTVLSYEVEIKVNFDSFNGRAVLDISLTADTREDCIVLHAVGLTFNTVKTGVLGGSVITDASFFNDGRQLKICPVNTALSHTVIIEYTGQLSNTGQGLYLGGSNENTYLAMNLHPTYARRVFPCMDEPTEAPIISFSFEGLHYTYTHLISNSMLVEDSLSHFRPLTGPPHLWGMMATNLVNINTPTANVLLFARPGVSNADLQASVAINSFFNNLNEWTQKSYVDVVRDQNGAMNIIALPDVSTDWNSLSIVGIWEPYVLMEPAHAVKQRAIALTKIAEAMSRQWFGYVIYPQNWRYEWIVAGFTTYSAYEMMRMFQTNFATDINLLDVNTLFVTEVIQESLLRDAYINSNPLEPADDLFDEDAIRDHVNGLVKIKSAAIMRMIRLVLGDANKDFIQIAARALLNFRALNTVNTVDFIDGINSELVGSNNNMFTDFGEYLKPWIENSGYSVLLVSYRPDTIVLDQLPFSFTYKESSNLLLPITYTTSIEKNFDKIHPQFMLDGLRHLNIVLDDDDDWIIFNIQGQGYYRVNYEIRLWERIIKALENPERRKDIHPLNRATLVDDALNLARAGDIDYEVALRVVLSMEHETEYAVWKAFVRNMSYLKKRLEAYVFDDEDLDSNIYLRMIHRTIPAFEREVTFYPNMAVIEPSMTSLTRGLVMDHACRAGYRPCIAAAVDWFYDPDNKGVVNPNIPHEIRPAVYCTMVREGGEDAIEALLNRLEIEPTHYERVVILESLACSDDPDFINGYLMQTIVSTSPYSVEERVKIFAAVAESSYTNADLARDFMRLRVNEIRNMYGVEKLEQLIFVLAENMADKDLTKEFRMWVQSPNNNLGNSQMAAERALAYVYENLKWIDWHVNYVYRTISHIAPPIDPTEPSSTVDPTDPSDPPTPSSTVDPVDPSDPTEPSSTVDPTDPSDTTEPSSTVDPSDPSDPPTPSSTVDPVDPSDPTEPSSTVDPTDPSDTTEPSSTVDPTDPSDSTDPDNPGVTDDPSVFDPNHTSTFVPSLVTLYVPIMTIMLYRYC